MTTKVLNKLVNVCTTLSDEITSWTTTSGDSSHTHSDYLTKSELIDLFYPVGSIYTSMNSTSPADIFGGTWEQITNRFLYCADSSGSTGGSSSLSEANLPVHTHTFTGVQATDSIQFRRSNHGSNVDVYANNVIFGENASSIQTTSWQVLLKK